MASVIDSSTANEKVEKAEIGQLTAADFGAFWPGTPKFELLSPSTANKYLPKFDDFIQQLPVQSLNKNNNYYETTNNNIINKSNSNKWPVDQEKMADAAKQLNQAFNSSYSYSPSRLFSSSKTGWGYDFNQAYKILENKTAEEIEAIDDIYAKTYGAKFATKGEHFGISSQMQRSATAAEIGRYEMLLENKKSNDVPQEFRVTGNQLLKPGSNLEVGEVNDIKLGDRHYGVYVPKNADSRAPVVIAIHGVTGPAGGSPREKLGMVAAAELTGSVVIFPYAKVQEFDAGTILNKLKVNNGSVWNVPGRINLPAKENGSYSDVDYLDSIIEDVKTKVNIADKVGLAGFSDGGRLAQIYAAERPNKVSAIYSSHSTWMDGEKLPESPVPIKIVLGTDDRTLPIAGGMGRVSKVLDWLVKTNLDLSKPKEQQQVWSQVNGCNTNPRTADYGDLSIVDYNCKRAPVVVNIIKGSQHAWDDPGNMTSPALQKVLHATTVGTRSMGIDAQRWLKQNTDSSNGMAILAIN